MKTRDELLMEYANNMLRASLEHFEKCNDPCDIERCESRIAAQFRVARKRYSRMAA